MGEVENTEPNDQIHWRGIKERMTNDSKVSLVWKKADSDVGVREQSD